MVQIVTFSDKIEMCIHYSLIMMTYLVTQFMGHIATFCRSFPNLRRRIQNKGSPIVALYTLKMHMFAKPYLANCPLLYSLYDRLYQNTYLINSAFLALSSPGVHSSSLMTKARSTRNDTRTITPSTTSYTFEKKAFLK